ncbi:MAG TPA: hypothetical protein EYP31_07245 [Roseibacterium sp.]|nr:hypothetical protein [Roseibacterium sp.]
MSSDDKKKTLTDAEITTDRSSGHPGGHPGGRRGFMGLMAAGGVAGLAGGAATLAPGAAQSQSLTDSDNGSWFDGGGCGRGSGGYATGVTDADDGSLGTDAPGYGRGAPYC